MGTLIRSLNLYSPSKCLPLPLSKQGLYKYMLISSSSLHFLLCFSPSPPPPYYTSLLETHLPDLQTAFLTTLFREQLLT